MADGTLSTPGASDSTGIPTTAPRKLKDMGDGTFAEVVHAGGTGTSSQQVQGTAADGAAASGNPVQIGGTDTAGNAQRILTDTLGHPLVTLFPGGTPLSAASGNVANAAATATLAAAAGATNYITGFTCTATGSTAAAVVNVTVAGLIGGTATFTFLFPAGATVLATPLLVTFPTPIPASAANTAITVTLPAGGAGNTNASVNVFGFRV